MRHITGTSPSLPIVFLDINPPDAAGSSQTRGVRLSHVLRMALLYSLFPVVATIIGALVAARWPGIWRWRSYTLSFAAGVVFSVVSVELLPEVMRRSLIGYIVIGFVIGVGTMFGVRRLTESMGMGKSTPSPGGGQPTNSEDNPTALIVAVGVDFLLDGLLLGIGFAAGAKIGLLLALAETAEQFSVGLALVGELKQAGIASRRAVLTATGLALLVFVTAVAGATVLSRMPDRLFEAVLSFGLASLLFLVTEELLAEAYEEPRTARATAMFFAGFLLFLVIGAKVG